MQIINMNLCHCNLVLLLYLIDYGAIMSEFSFYREFYSVIILQAVPNYSCKSINSFNIPRLSIKPHRSCNNGIGQELTENISTELFC